MSLGRNSYCTFSVAILLCPLRDQLFRTIGNGNGIDISIVVVKFYSYILIVILTIRISFLILTSLESSHLIAVRSMILLKLGRLLGLDIHISYRLALINIEAYSLGSFISGLINSLVIQLIFTLLGELERTLSFLCFSTFTSITSIEMNYKCYITRIIILV